MSASVARFHVGTMCDFRDVSVEKTGCESRSLRGEDGEMGMNACGD